MLLHCVTAASVASPGKIRPQKLRMLYVRLEFCSFFLKNNHIITENNAYRIVLHRVDQTIVPEVTEIVLITILLVPLPYLFLLKLIRALLTHLPPVEIVNLFLLQPVSLITNVMLTYFFLRLMLRFNMVNVSLIRSNLTFLSSGLSVPNDASALTSNTRGFILCGFFLLRHRIMSNPRTSKESEFSRSSGWHERQMCCRFGCTEMIVFAMMSQIFSQSLSASTPFWASV